MWTLRLFGLGAAAAATLAVLGCGFGGPQTVSSGPPSATAPAVASSVRDYQVGEVFTTGSWQFVVHTLTDPVPATDPEAGSAGAGRRYISVDIEAKNLATAARRFDAGFFQTQDSTGLSRTLVYHWQGGNQEGSLVAAGASVRRTIYLKVNADSTGLFIHIGPPDARVRVAAAR